MSYGFSVGDFIAVGQLIKDIVTSLRSVGGAKSEYQDLIRELNLLEVALQHLDRLENSGCDESKINSIKYAALSCRHPLSVFLAKIKKYEKSLGVWGGSGAVKTTVDKLKFSFGQSDDIQRLQTYLNVHVGTINILLAEHGLDVMADAAATTAAHNARVCEQLQVSQTILATIEQNVSAQANVLKQVYSMLNAVHGLVSGELRTSWNRFSQMISSVCVSTQQIYAVVVEIRESITAPDTRMTYFQAPLLVEDAIGYKFPVPSEYDFDLLDTIIRRRFKTGSGHRDVEVGNYELCKANDRSVIITESTRLLPGMGIRMAIILAAKYEVAMSCPMPRCDSLEAEKYPGGGFTCVKCHVWFDKTSKRRVNLSTLIEAIYEPKDVATGQFTSAKSHANIEANLEQNKVENYDSLRNVVWAQREAEAEYNTELDDTEPKSEALKWVDELKEATRQVKRPDLFNAFLDLMRSFKRHETDTVGVAFQWIGIAAYLPPIWTTKINEWMPEGYSVEYDDGWVCRTPTGPRKLAPSRLSYPAQSQDLWNAETSSKSGGDNDEIDSDDDMTDDELFYELSDDEAKS